MASLRLRFDRVVRSTLFVGVLFCVATSFAQGTSELNAQNPFALRAARNAANAATQNDETESNVPQNAPKNDAPSSYRYNASSAADVSDVLCLADGRKVACVVESISGRGGVAVSTSKGTQTIPTRLIASVDLDVSDAFCRGVDAFASGERSGASSEYRRALTLFQEARKNAARRLEKEWATAKIVETYVALGQDDEAASEFFLLCRLDPFSGFLRFAPLRWVNQTTLTRGSTAETRRLAEETAAEWLDAVKNPTNAPNPVGRLLAGSLLLNSREHGKEALAALQALVVLEPPENADEETKKTCRTIALLATAQLWRLELLKKPTEREVERWAKTRELLPEEFRVGSSALLAQGRRSLGQDEACAREFLRVATLASTNFALASAATNEAANAYERLGRVEIARRLREDASTRFGKDNE